MYTVLSIALLILITIILKMLLIVEERENVIVERLGKFKKILKPGFYFLIPFVDKVAYRREMREQVLDIPSQSVITKDNIQVEVDGLIYIKVMDCYKSCYGVSNYSHASVNLAQTTMRSEIGKLTLSQTFSERDTLNENIVREVDKASNPWGIKVHRYEIKNIEPSRNVVLTLEKQMEAEREKRAEITRANAEKESVFNVSEGEKVKAINISEGEKQKRINESHGKAESIKIIAEATSKGLEMIATSIQETSGDKAIKMQLLENYIANISPILENADVSIFPTELATLKGIFDELRYKKNIEEVRQ